jgi:hypothetical protein
LQKAKENEMNFIEERIQELETLSEKFFQEFSGLSAEEMDMKPDADRWSINECLDHIIQSNKSYFSTFDAIATEKFRRNIWSKLPGLPSLWGKLILGAVSPDTQKRTKTFKVWYPLSSHYGRNLTNELASTNADLSKKLQGMKNVNMDEVFIASPAGEFITYRLRVGISILVEHEKRHFNQAKQVKNGLTLKIKING